MKSKNPRFLAIYNSRWPSTIYGTLRWGAGTFREAFGNPNKLPRIHFIDEEDNCEYITSVDGTQSVTLILHNPTKGVRCKHRVFVKCDRCNKDVPAGRIHQHTC